MAESERGKGMQCREKDRKERENEIKDNDEAAYDEELVLVHEDRARQVLLQSLGQRRFPTICYAVSK